MKTLANEIVVWLKDYAVKNNRQSFIVGVSGGVDSALVSTLCAMTEIRTIGVIMPCQSKDNETDRGMKHIWWLQSQFKNVSGNTIDLTKTFETFRDNLSPMLHNDLGFANTKSRLRMIALYQVATVNGGLVVGTGNKIEDFGVGFFTKYGDGGVDISPIADLTKTEVRKMAKELGVSEEIVNVTPTDGLWADARSDESQLGASYEELEWAMNYRELPDKSSIMNAREEEVLKIYDKWHKAGAHKLLSIPTFKRCLIPLEISPQTIKEIAEIKEYREKTKDVSIGQY